MTFRPGVESLEAREVPALFAWTGAVDTDFDNPLNWVPQDEGMPGGPPSESRAPLAGDDLIFAPTLPETPWGSPVSRPCTNMHAATGGDLSEAYNSVTLTSDYASFVNLWNGFTTRSFTLAGGSIKQPTGKDITVTTAFYWTGGTLNSTPSNANVNINGSGTITLPTGGTLTCGSTLNFGNPTAAAVETIISGAGTLLMNGTNQNAIYVGADAKVKVVASPGAENWIDSLNKTLTLDFGGEWGYVGSGPTNLAHQVINNGGRFYLNGQVTLKLTGGDVNTPGYTQNSNWLFTPKLEIMSGCLLDVLTSKGILIAGGEVWQAGNTDLAAPNQRATIWGNYTMTGGSINFLAPTLIGNENVWGLLDVAGDVIWSGGSFNPGLNCAPGAPATGPMLYRGNQWRVAGTMTINVGGPSQPTINPVPQFLPQGQQASGTWDLIEAVQGGKIQGGSPAVPAGWTLSAQFAPNGVDKTKWKVTR